VTASMTAEMDLMNITAMNRQKVLLPQPAQPTSGLVEMDHALIWISVVIDNITA
jgi:hypothetical protein